MTDQDKMQVDVGEPVAWRWPYRFRDIGETGAYEHHSHVFAVLNNMPHGEPLFTADQLAAAVAAEREKCAGIVNELRMECARRNMPESATMLWHAEDAIRAGANGLNSD